MLDVLDHSTNDDVILSQDIIFKSWKNHIILLNLLLLVLHDQKISINVLDINIGVLIIVQFVEVCCNHSLFNLIKALEIEIAILILELRVAFLEHLLSFR